MRRFGKCPLFSASSTLAVLTVGSQLVLAQSALAAPVPAAPVPAAPLQQPAAAATTQPQFQMTQEDVGDGFMTHKQYQLAIEAYKKAPPDSAEIWNKMGIAYQLMFDNTDALRCYLAALKREPNNSATLNNLGTVYVSLQDHRMAERYYRKSLKQDPKSATVLKNLGTDLLVRHKYKQGGQYYAAAMAIDPHIFDSSSAIRIENGASLEGRGAMNYYMAKTCVRAGMKDRAVEYLRLALNEGFTNPKKIVSDSEFSSLHGLPAFEQMLAAQKTQ